MTILNTFLTFVSKLWVTFLFCAQFVVCFYSNHSCANYLDSHFNISLCCFNTSEEPPHLSVCEVIPL